MAAILDIHDVTVAYHRRPVLWDVDLTLHEPQLAAIVGPNGAGKSTLIKAVLGLVPMASGQLQVFGQPASQVRKRIGYVPQRESVDWDFPVSVLDVVLMGTYGQLGWIRRPGAAQRNWARECLDQVGLASYERQQIGQLSGGQQQRVFLARALVQQADIYFMDEPMAGVDAATERMIFHVLEDLREQGKTIIAVHHDLRTVPQYFDYVVLLNVRLVAAGPREVVFTPENLKKTYGGRLRAVLDAASEAVEAETRAVISSLVQLARENYNLLVVLAGSSLLGIGAGIIGAFAVLRKRALTGDALSHAALPGLCIAFLILRERNLIALLIGALASGVVGIAIISALGRWTRVRGDAAIGTVLTVFFGLGVVLLEVIQNLPGVGSRAGLNSYIFGKTAGMTQGDVWVILLAAAACLAFIVVFYKEFQLVSFDAEFAQALGWPVYGVDLVLMSLVAAAVVIGLPSVGVILVSALLIMPGAAARFWTDRLGTLLVIAGGFGFLMGFAGTLLSAADIPKFAERVFGESGREAALLKAFANLPTGPIIVLTGTAIFTASMLFGWRRGAIARLLAHLRFQRQWYERQLLRTIYDALEEQPQQVGVTRDSLLSRRAWTPRQLDRMLAAAAADKLVSLAGDRIELTPAGSREAVQVARGQRLWQEFLTAYPQQAGSVVNLASASIDEHVPAATVAELTAKLRAEGRWPGEEALA